MAPEERMLERFTKERQRASRGTAFNLEDEDDLTHFGQSLSNMDDFDGIGLALDDEEEDGPRGQIDAQTVRRAHFGGFEEEEDDEQEDGQVCDFATVIRQGYNTDNASSPLATIQV